MINETHIYTVLQGEQCNGGTIEFVSSSLEMAVLYALDLNKGVWVFNTEREAGSRVDLWV